MTTQLARVRDVMPSRKTKRAFLAIVSAMPEPRCFYCRRRLVIASPIPGAIVPPDLLTRDHYIPKSRGGWGKIENLLPCCYFCNAAKADRDPAEFLATFGRGI